jgi:putative flippase GtrA
MPPENNLYSSPSGSSRVWERVRHHTGSMIASTVDFTTMIVTVEILRAHAVVSTAIGALCGALTSFFLGRTWVFHRSDVAPAGQLLRYAMVAAASLGLNVLGEYLLVVRAGVGYVRARVVVAVLVSNLWNYPLHRYFVFGTRPRVPLPTER